jgi:HPt (histidine-containing phosphotransfer) domain-containing protein/anti-sigma regulatory factor (Ser/Thr protein kinase)
MRSDLHTPLSGIMNFAQLVKDEVQDPRIAEYAGNMFASSKALLDFVNEILEVINITSGELPILKKKFDVINKIESTIALLKAKANAKKIALNFSIDEKLPRYWVGDFKRLNRIALEIIANALNFTHEGKVDVSLELARQNENNGVLKLTVRDTGIGIPQDKQGEIFLRFSRLRPSFDGVYKGAGLGLTIAKQFLDELQGEIYVDSEVNQGSTFTVLIPMSMALLQDDSGIDKSPDHTITSRVEKIVVPKQSRAEKKIALKKEKPAVKDVTLPQDENLFELSGETLALDETLKKYNNDRDTVNELFKMLLESLESEEPKLKVARKKNDWKAIEKIAHKSRGSACYCGTKRFEQACANLENYLKNPEVELREKLLDQMLQEAEVVKREVKAFLV